MALSPAGARKTSAPERLAPITFCFTPPIETTDPSSSNSPVAATLSPRSTPPRSSSTMSSANASPADGPPTPPRSISTSIGSCDVRRLLDLDSDDRPTLLGGALDRPDLDAPRRAAGAHRQRHRLTGLVLRDQPAQAIRSLHRLAVDPDDHLGCLDLAVGGRAGRDVDDERSLRLGHDVVAELAERDRGGDLLRAVHLPKVLAAALCVVRSRRDDRLLGDEVGAVGAGEGARAPRAPTPAGRSRRRS